MRPRWRSRGDGPADCIRRTAASAEDGGSRACCCARNAAQPQGKKVGGAVAGQGRAGARPAEMRGRIGLRRHRQQRTTLAVGASSARSVPPARQPSRCHGHHASLAAQRCALRPTRHRPCRARCRRRIEPIGETEPLQSRTCSNQAGASKSESNDAISASGALNRPRLSSGGTTASTASSFSEGSMRR
jgi:hypothetical protein